MEALYRYYSAMILAMISIFAPIAPLIICVVVFIAVDFVTGVWASHEMALKANKRWYFESEEAWRTLYKLGFTLIAVAMAWLLESFVLDFMELKLTKLLVGFVCGVELWSFLENATQISESEYLVWMRRFLRRRIKKEMER